MNHRDPTADMAIGNVNREWSRMMKLAVRIRLNPQYQTPEALREFSGIYRRLLTDPLDELLKEAPKSKKDASEK